MRISSYAVFIGGIIFCGGLLLSAGKANGQEYAKMFPVMEDSVMQQITRLAEYLHSQLSTSVEMKRDYRDSIYNALRKADSSFLKPETLQPATLTSKLPHPAIKLISDFAWNDFVLSAGRKSSLSLLPALASQYPLEPNIQGNFVLALELEGSTDSAIAVADNFLRTYAKGFTALNIDKNILFYRSGSLKSSAEIINLGADSFKTWVQDKLYKYPAPIDSLRNALAAVISQRAGILKAPDVLLGQLILDYGDLCAREKIYRPAMEYYDLAFAYDAGLKPLIEKRVAVINELEKSVKSTFTWASIIFAVPLLAFVLIFVGWIRNKFPSFSRRGGA